ncbi:mechanosensitive ion channel family protein [Paraburkholderia graminis]|uniref:Small-conductance mechanosensitive channel/CRP-like cAMP-binding protein n=1 Tax=Paraburkholderia graminis TaxID=60548 RepID=A0ABD5CLS3_9BURK|nr:mechanosensitive ion channel family protein [Paraburkholderia graminis]MDR6205485.1 small-conductance mechanosensitive channel/CRP-like cAMP-binding protein [Paraburkholderia graminis]
MSDSLVFGYAVVLIDVALWRFKVPKQDVSRLLLRLAIFAVFTASIFTAGLSPFRQATHLEASLLHEAAQALKIFWWLTGARLFTLALDALLLPQTWRKQRLFQDVFGAVVFLAAAVAATGFVLEIPVRGLIATSGTLAVILGLAIQSTLHDVFAGIVLNSTEPYRVGDWISIDGAEGKVIEMNWRATHLLNSHGNVTIVPNAAAAKANITNTNRPHALHGVTVSLEISPDERPATVIAALECALAAARSILPTPAPFVQARKSTIHSIQCEATAFVDDTAKKTPLTNELYDLCYRHLTAAGVALRPPGVPSVTAIVANAEERLLRRIELFAAISDDELKMLSSCMVRHEYDAGQVIFTPEVVPDSLAIVDSGVLSVSTEQSTGAVEVVRLGPGDTMGETGLLAGLPVQVKIVTLTRSVIYRLSKDAVTPLLRDSQEVTHRMCRLLSQRQDMLHKMAMKNAAHADDEHASFHWLLDKIHRLHALKF